MAGTVTTVPIASGRYLRGIVRRRRRQGVQMLPITAQFAARPAQQRLPVPAGDDDFPPQALQVNGSRSGQLQAAEPAPQRVAQAPFVPAAQGGNQQTIGTFSSGSGQIAIGQFIQQRRRVGAQPGGAGQRGGCGGPARLEQRRDGMAQIIAIRLAAGVAGILDPAQAVRLRIGADNGPVARQQGA